MNKLSGRIDWLMTLVPFIILMALAGVLFIFPNQSNDIIGQVRFFFGDTLGIYYLVIGLGVLLVSAFLSQSTVTSYLVNRMKSQSIRSLPGEV